MVSVRKLIFVARSVREATHLMPESTPKFGLCAKNISPPRWNFDREPTVKDRSTMLIPIRPGARIADANGNSETAVLPATLDQSS